MKYDYFFIIALWEISYAMTVNIFIFYLTQCIVTYYIIIIIIENWKIIYAIKIVTLVMLEIVNHCKQFKVIALEKYWQVKNNVSKVYNVFHSWFLPFISKIYLWRNWFKFFLMMKSILSRFYLFCTIRMVEDVCRSTRISIHRWNFQFGDFTQERQEKRRSVMARGEREKESKRGEGGKKKSTRRKRLLMSDPRNLAASRKRRKRGRSLARAEGGGQICKPDWNFEI